MKTIQKIIFLAAVLGASGFTAAQTTEPAPNPMATMDRTDTDDDSGKWGLAGLLGLLGLLGMRRHHEVHSHGRGTNTR